MRTAQIMPLPNHIFKHLRIGNISLEIVARTGDGMVEALEYSSEQMVLGIQWHPERIADPAVGRPVFEFLAELAKT